MKKYVLVEGYAMGDVMERAAGYLGLDPSEVSVSEYCLDGGWAQAVVSKTGDELSSRDAWSLVGCDGDVADLSYDDDRADIVLEEPIELEDGSQLIAAIWGYDSDGETRYQI